MRKGLVTIYIVMVGQWPVIYRGIIYVRNIPFWILYRLVVRPILFCIDPEKCHDFFTWSGQLMGSNCVTRAITRLCFGYSTKSLNTLVMDIEFENPIGLAQTQNVH